MAYTISDSTQANTPQFSDRGGQGGGGRGGRGGYPKQVAFPGNCNSCDNAGHYVRDCPERNTYWDPHPAGTEYTATKANHKKGSKLDVTMYYLFVWNRLDYHHAIGKNAWQDTQGGASATGGHAAADTQGGASATGGHAAAVAYTISDSTQANTPQFSDRGGQGGGGRGGRGGYPKQVAFPGNCNSCDNAGHYVRDCPERNTYWDPHPAGTEYTATKANHKKGSKLDVTMYYLFVWNRLDYHHAIGHNAWQDTQGGASVTGGHAAADVADIRGGED